MHADVAASVLPCGDGVLIIDEVKVIVANNVSECCTQNVFNRSESG